MRIAETTRLFLREFTIADAKSLHLLNLDAEVIKYTGDKAFESIDDAKTFLENYDHYVKYGFGRWAVADKTNNGFIGWCGLKYTPALDEVDIGFRFFKEHWNKGFATESAKASLHLGFTTFKVQEIAGRVMKENIGSIRVLEKIGLSYYKSLDFDGKEGMIYKIKNSL